MTRPAPEKEPIEIERTVHRTRLRVLMKNRPPKRNYGKMRSTVATIARERIDILLDQAKETLPKNPDLSVRYVELARKISMRTKVRIPREKKHYLCKNCGQPLVLGKNARVRVRPGNSRIIITCLNCGALRRYPFTKSGLTGPIF